MKTKIYIIFVVIFACTTIIRAQIPNYDFENWSSVNIYDIPTSWDDLNSTTIGSSIYTAEKGTPGASAVAGTYFIKLTSKAVPGQGIVPGIAVSGKLNKTTLKPISGFAFNQRPASLTGNWKYMVYSATGVNDSGYIDVQLTRWDAAKNKRDTVAGVHNRLPGMKMSWKPFTIALTYVDNVNYPDSAIITLSASGSNPTAKDFLYIDDLAFTGIVAPTVTTIPNADFENWISNGTYNSPALWDNLNNVTAAASVYTAEQGTPGAAGVAGTSYLQLTTKTVPGQWLIPGIAVSGILDKTTLKPVSGFAFNQRPASLTGNWQYMVYSDTGVNDSGYVDVKLTRWDPVLKIRNTVASLHYNLPDMVMDWAGFSLPLTYVDNVNYPDSAIITLSASGVKPTESDFLYVDNLAFSGTVATDGSLGQIPNYGFETWTSSTYNIPTSWDNINSTTTASGIYTAEQGTPGVTGSSYLKLTTKNISGVGIVPGIAVSGTINKTTLKPVSGFAFNQRPTSLTGSWQYMVYSAKGVADSGYIDVQLTRWDATMSMRNTVAGVHYRLPGMKMSWKTFSIPLTYVDNVNYPDSAVITLSASGSIPTARDFLYVDNLAFEGTQLVNGIAGVSGNKKFNVYPNPASDRINFELPLTNNSKADIQILNLQGVIVKSIKDVDATSTVSVDISGLPAGNYILKVVSTDVFVSRFIKE